MLIGKPQWPSQARAMIPGKLERSRPPLGLCQLGYHPVCRRCTMRIPRAKHDGDVDLLRSANAVRNSVGHHIGQSRGKADREKRPPSVLPRQWIKALDSVQNTVVGGDVHIALPRRQYAARQFIVGQVDADHNHLGFLQGRIPTRSIMRIKKNAFCTDIRSKPLRLLDAASGNPDGVAGAGQNFRHLTADMAIAPNYNNMHGTYLNSAYW